VSDRPASAPSAPSSAHGLEVETVETASLGNATHLIGTGDGGAVVVDPPRDAWRIAAAAAGRGWRITHVLETHVHNDYLSGALELRASDGVRIVAPAAGRYDFPHDGVEAGDAIEVGGLRFRPHATPGHTPEHLAWEIERLDGDAADGPLAVATGGALLVGSAGRTDLLGPERVEALTAAQFASLRYLAGLPPSVAILPTHGAGSFCAAGPPAGGRTTTVGDERRSNPLLAIADVEAFRATVVAGYGAYPTYYREMAGLNRAGPPVLGGPPAPRRLDPAEVERAVERGAIVVDGRGREAFAAGHLPGALNVEVEDDAFAPYVGWHVPFGSTLVLVLPGDGEDLARQAVTELLRIGYDRIAGVLDGGVDAWRRSGRPTAGFPVVSPGGAAGESTLLDVRDPAEWRDDGTVDGALRIPLWQLRERLDEVPADQSVTVLCRSGRRASIAASILHGAGREVRVIARGGVKEIRASV
jgi:hydroxyacylglutathione hydrolase